MKQALSTLGMDTFFITNAAAGGVPSQQCFFTVVQVAAYPRATGAFFIPNITTLFCSTSADAVALRPTLALRQTRPGIW